MGKASRIPGQTAACKNQINHTKRKYMIAGVVLAVLMLVIGLSAYAASSDDSCGDNLTWSYDSDTTTLTISGYGDMYDYGSTSSTGAPWYAYRKQITKIVLDCTNTSSGIGIGDYAFYNCSSAASITGDETLTEIGSYAFYNCSSLAELDISGVTAIGDHAFYGNDSMTGATVNAAITEIPEFIFQGCDSLEKVVLLGDVTEIGAGAFYQCVMLDTLVYSAKDTTEDVVYIADTVETIGKQAFYGCVSYDDDNEPSGGISKVVFEGDSVEFDAATKKNEAQFYDCEYLSSITLPSAQTQIAPYLLYGCTSLQTVTIPETVTAIGKYAFSSTGLTSVTIPAAVAEMGSFVFSDNAALTEVFFAENSTLTAIPDYAFYNSGIKTITIPDSVESVGGYAFKDCTALANITFGTAVTSLGSYMLYGCTADLVELHFTGEYTYTGADGNEAEISISDTAFKGITGVGYYPAESTTWPAGTAVSTSTIYGATSFVWAAEGEEVGLTDWYTIDEETGTLYIYLDGDMPNYAQSSTPWYSKRESIENIVFNYNPDEPDETYALTSIGSYAFYGFSVLDSVTIPASVTSIGDCAFQNCVGTSVTQTQDGDYMVFSGDGTILGLTSVTFEEGSRITEIGDRAFSGCCFLESITLPASLTEIGDYAFYECGTYAVTAGLAYILESGDTADAELSFQLRLGSYGNSVEVKEITVNGSTLTLNEDYTYSAGIANNDWLYSEVSFTEDYLESLAAGTYTGSVQYENFMCPFTLIIYDADTEEIPADSGTAEITYYGLADIDLSGIVDIGSCAFYGCGALQSVTFGSLLETIGQMAFYECEAFTEISLPESLQEIGSNAFAYTSVEKIILHAGLTVGYGAFYSCTKLADVIFEEDESAEITTLGSYAFAGCTALQEITLPAGFTGVSEGLFSNCTSLTSLTLEGAVTAVGADAFSGCAALGSVTGLSSVSSIGDNAFYDCSALTSLDLPETLTNDQVGDFVFYRCAGLADESGFVVINGVLYSYVYSILGIDIAYGTTLYNTGSSSSGIEDVTIPVVTVPEEVTEIANYAFYQIVAPMNGTNSSVSTVTLEGLEFTCAADEIEFEEYAMAGLPLLAGYEGHTAAIVFPCSDADAWTAKFEAYGLTGTGEALGYRYSTSWSLELEVGHQLGEDAVRVEPTCTEDGSLTYTCTVCGETVIEVLEATGHTSDESEVTVLKEATCTEEGEITYTCTVCGETVTEATAALGHTLGEGTVTTEPTCTEEGVVTYTCTVCGETVTEAIAAAGHSYDAGTVTTEPTCTDEGVMTYTCTVCDESTEGHTYTEAIAALSESGEHDYIAAETVEATCTGDGYIVYICYVCGDEYTEVLAATGHTPDEGTVLTAATGTKEGEILYTCTVCGETWTEAIAALSETGGTSVQKKKQTLKVKTVRKKTVKYKKLKKKKQTVKVIKKVTGAKTKVTYKKVSGKKCLTVNKKTGRVTIKKGTKKGTYKIKIKVSAKKTAKYKAASKIVTVKIKVK